MIKPEFLAELRRQQRSEMILLMVQLEQIIPCWHESIASLAEQLGTDRATLNRGLVALEKRGLIKYYSISNRSGTWIWWVKRHRVDIPLTKDEPGWTVKLLSNRALLKIRISQRREWAKARNISFATLCGFLNGRQKVLYGKWELVSSPFDADTSD